MPKQQSNVGTFIGFCLIAILVSWTLCNLLSVLKEQQNQKQDVKKERSTNK